MSTCTQSERPGAAAVNFGASAGGNLPSAAGFQRFLRANVSETFPHWAARVLPGDHANAPGRIF